MTYDVYTTFKEVNFTVGVNTGEARFNSYDFHNKIFKKKIKIQEHITKR